MSLLAACHPGNSLPTEEAQVLASANQVTLYSLEPTAQTASQYRFYGYTVLGKTTLTGADTKKATHAFQTAISHWNGAVAACFEPRHALSITANNHTYDYLLCYSCESLAVYKDGKSVGGVGISGSPEALNALLMANHITLSSKPNE